MVRRAQDKGHNVDRFNEKLYFNLLFRIKSQDSVPCNLVGHWEILNADWTMKSHGSDSNEEPHDWSRSTDHKRSIIYKSSSVIISSFSVMRSLGESLGIHHNHWPKP